MLTIKRVLTFFASLALLGPVCIFDTVVGSVLWRVSTGTALPLLALVIGLAFILCLVMTFGGVLPWCRAADRGVSINLVRICGCATILAIGLLLYLYSAITFLDEAPRSIQVATTGMTKSQVVSVIGEPDWREGNAIWAYRVRGDGLAGIFLPYYLSFDAKGLLKSIHS